MCGIVGVLGKNEVAPILVESLKRLEYRGYDSAGVATIEHGKLDRRRAVGKLVELSDVLVREPLRGRAGQNWYNYDWDILGPLQQRITADSLSSKYAWTAVMMYMLSHYDYVHE